MALYSKKNQKKPREAYQNNGMSTVPYAMQAIKPSATVPYAKQAIKPSATAPYANQFDLPAKIGKNNEKMFYTEPENSGIIGKKTIGDYDTEIAGFDNKIAKLMKQQYNHMLSGETDKMKAITPWIQALEDKRDTVKLGKAGALGIGKWDSKSLLGQDEGTSIHSTSAARSRADVSLSEGEDLDFISDEEYNKEMARLEKEKSMRVRLADGYDRMLAGMPLIDENYDYIMGGYSRNIDKAGQYDKAISDLKERRERSKAAEAGDENIFSELNELAGAVGNSDMRYMIENVLANSEKIISEVVGVYDDMVQEIHDENKAYDEDAEALYEAYVEGATMLIGNDIISLILPKLFESGSSEAPLVKQGDYNIYRVSYYEFYGLAGMSTRKHNVLILAEINQEGSISYPYHVYTFNHIIDTPWDPMEGSGLQTKNNFYYEYLG